MKHILMIAALAALSACAPPQSAQVPAPSAAPAAPIKVEAPSGTYTLDKAHANLTFHVNHMGFSHYTAQFTKFDATIQLDTADPAKSSVTATIDPKSLLLNTPPKGFTETITGPQWLAAAQFPQMTFKSTKVEMTGPDTAKIDGDFTLHGVTAPVTMEAKFNGGYPGFAMDPHARVGFSAHGVLKRSAFGVALGIPQPGSSMGVGDDVDFAVEAEFSGPAWVAPASSAAPAP